MARPKKVTEQPSGNTDNPLTEEAAEPITTPEVIQVEPTSVMTKPLFTTDNSEIYRALLLERPNVPVITNIKEAVDFVEVYQRWNRKVQIAFK